MRIVTRSAAWIALLAAAGGCERSVDMAAVQSPGWNATTIPYAGVREENRRFPDYSIIGASVLTTSAPAAGDAPHRGKQGAPR